jgi:putative N6-adenine-specific DNA methylase
VTAWIRFAREDAAAAVPPPGPGVLAVNPPYGVRLDEEVAGAWRALGALLARLPGWRAAVLAPDRGLERLLPPGLSSSLPVSNGGLRCRLLRYDP